MAPTFGSNRTRVNRLAQIADPDFQETDVPIGSRAHDVLACREQTGRLSSTEIQQRTAWLDPCEREALMSIPGAEPARLGYRFEDWIILEYLADVIGGRAVAVEFEGPIEQWTEARIRRLDGTVETVQSKTTSEIWWTLSRLRSSGVLDGMQQAAALGSPFRFVSDKTTELTRAAEHATIEATASESAWLADAEARRLRDTIDKLAKAIGAGTTAARELLLGTRFDALDDSAAEKIARTAIAPHVRPAQRSAVVDALITGLSDRHGLLGHEIDAALIDSFLTNRKKIVDWRGATPFDARTSLQTLTATFLTAPGRHRPTARPEADRAVSLIADHPMVTVEAPGGYGKSVVLTQAIRQLGDDGYAVGAVDARALPDKIDRIGEYQAAIGLPDGLVEALALQDKAVFVLDQLDSVAPSLGGTSGRWTVVSTLLQKAVEYRIPVLLGCRPVNGLTAMLPPCERLGLVSLGPWTEGEMLEFTGAARPLPTGIPRIPVLGAIWKELGEYPGDEPATAGTLLTRYREDVRLRCGLSSAEMASVESVLANEIEHRGNTPCPRNRLTMYSDAVETLVRDGYLDASAQGVAFRHEVVAEHAWASAFDAAGADLEALLRSARLDLHRRIRSYLQFLAHGGQGRSVDLTRTLRRLLDRRVRSAVAATALYWLVECDRTSAPTTWPPLRDELLGDVPWRSQLASKVMRDNCRFFDLAFESAAFTELARTPEGRNDAIWIASAACSSHSEDVASLAIELAGTGNPRTSEWNWWSYLAVKHPVATLLAVWLSWIGTTSSPDDFLVDEIQFRQLADRSPTAAAAVLQAWLHRHRELASATTEEGPFSFEYRLLEAHPRFDEFPSVGQFAANHPEAFVEGCSKEILICTRLLGGAKPGSLVAMSQYEVDGVLRPPVTWIGVFVVALRDAVTRSSAAAEAFLGVHGRATEDIAVAISAWSHAVLNRSEDAWAWLDGIVAQDPHLSEWTKAAVGDLLSALGSSTDSSIDPASENLTRWLAENDVAVGSSSDGQPEPLHPTIGFTGGQVESPFADEEAEQWDDAAWVGVLRQHTDPDARSITDGRLVGGSDEIAHQLRERANAEPERFAELLMNADPPLLASYSQAILDGIARSQVPIKIPLPAFEAVIERVPTDRSLLTFAEIVSRSMQEAPTELERNTLLRLAQTPPAEVGNWFAGFDQGVPADFEWRNRVDTTAVAGLGKWVNENPDDAALLDPFIDRAVEAHDAGLGAALAEALRWVLAIRPAEADGRMMDLLAVFPELADSIALSKYVGYAWRRGWPSLPEYWGIAARSEPGSSEKGLRWSVNCLRFGALPSLDEILSLPTASQAGVARLAAELSRQPDHDRWTVGVLAALLESADTDVCDAASRWEYEVTRIPDNDDGTMTLDRLPIPARFLALIPATVRSQDRLMETERMLLALAAGSSANAVQACQLADESLAKALPRSDLAHGHDVARTATIATVAHETLYNEGSDPAPALDLLDRLVEVSPRALAGDLSTLLS